MNLLEQDLPWLTSEARNDPDTAQQIIEALAARTQQLQQQADELRAENVLLKRSGMHQVYHEQVQRLKTDLRDLRIFAERHALNPDVVSLVSFTGHGLHLPAPLGMDQTLSLATADDEPVRDLKPLFMAGGARLDSLLVMTSSFRLVMANGLNFPLSENMDWRDTRASVSLARGERIEATCAVNELQPPRSLVVVTRRGWVRAMSWSLVENLVIGGQPITAPIAGDTPVWIGPAGDPATSRRSSLDGSGRDDLLLLTRNGAWTRFPLNSLDASGSMGIVLDQDDDVACAAVIGANDAAVYFVGADGAQLAIANAGLEAHKKPGAKPTTLTRRFIALTCYGAKKTDAVLLLTNNSDLIVETLRALPVAARPSEAQPLNAVNQRLIAATLLK